MSALWFLRPLDVVADEKMGFRMFSLLRFLRIEPYNSWPEFSNVCFSAAFQ